MTLYIKIVKDVYGNMESKHDQDSVQLARPFRMGRGIALNLNGTFEQ